MSEITLTDLQADLPTGMMRRSLDDVIGILDECPDFSLGNEISQRLDITGKRTLRVLSAACGAGADVEQICRQIANFSDFPIEVEQRVEGVGVDLRPQPFLIPASVLPKDERRGKRGSELMQALLARLITGDIQDLREIADDSIDIYWCVSGYQYVPNTLQALQECWRVLKKPKDGFPGGVMIVECPWRLISEPSIHQILGETPGASEAFSLRESRDPFRDYVYGQFVVARKKEDSTFEQFPFKLVGVKPGFEIPKVEREKHCVIGQYEASAWTAAISSNIYHPLQEF